MLELATALATIVGLMADYASRKSDKDLLEVKDFSEWLATNGHEEVKLLLEKNHATLVSVKATLNEGKVGLLERLNSIDRRLAILCEDQGPVGDLAKAIYPGAALSEQAKTILIELERSEATAALEQNDLDGVHLLFFDSKGSGGFRPSIERFFNDDLEKLVSLNLLSLSYNSKGRRLFRPTRQGSEFAQSLMTTC